jgi:hypothetical protein
VAEENAAATSDVSTVRGVVEPSVHAAATTSSAPTVEQDLRENMQ